MLAPDFLLCLSMLKFTSSTFFSPLMLVLVEWFSVNYGASVNEKKRESENEEKMEREIDGRLKRE